MKTLAFMTINEMHVKVSSWTGRQWYKPQDYSGITSYGVLITTKLF